MDRQNTFHGQNHGALIQIFWENMVALSDCTKSMDMKYRRFHGVICRIPNGSDSEREHTSFPVVDWWVNTERVQIKWIGDVHRNLGPKFKENVTFTVFDAVREQQWGQRSVRNVISHRKQCGERRHDQHILSQHTFIIPMESDLDLYALIHWETPSRSHWENVPFSIPCSSSNAFFQRFHTDSWGTNIQWMITLRDGSDSERESGCKSVGDGHRDLIAFGHKMQCVVGWAVEEKEGGDLRMHCIDHPLFGSIWWSEWRVDAEPNSNDRRRQTDSVLTIKQNTDRNTKRIWNETTVIHQKMIDDKSVATRFHFEWSCSWLWAERVNINRPSICSPNDPSECTFKIGNEWGSGHRDEIQHVNGGDAVHREGIRV